jgi:hypothetical protein
MMTSSEYSAVFRLLDDYARTRYHCFLAEFFLDKTGTEYLACFRPVGLAVGSPNRYACRYLHIGVGQLPEAAKHTVLPARIVELLARELPALAALSQEWRV